MGFRPEPMYVILARHLVDGKAIVQPPAHISRWKSYPKEHGYEVVPFTDRGLCGQRGVVYVKGGVLADPEDYPICPECLEILESSNRNAGSLPL